MIYPGRCCDLKSNVRKNLINAALLGGLFAITIWSVFRGESFREVVHFLSTADLRYIFPAILCVFIFIGGEASIIFYLLRVLGHKVRFLHCWMYSFIGFFYSCITPSASGGQPMQVIAMRKDKIPVPVSTVILAIIAITYKLVLVIIGAVVLTVRPANVMQHIDSSKELIYIGLGLNIICIAALLLLVFRPNTVKVIAEKSMSFFNRIRPFKHPERAEHLLEKLTGQYAGAAEFYRSNKHVLLNVFWVTFIQRCALFAITWLTYRSFHLAAENPATIMTLQSLISVASDMLPLPGGMGISENLFIEIFQNVFGEERVLPAMVISRGISHYTQLLISGIMTVAAVFIIKDRRHAEQESV